MRAQLPDPATAPELFNGVLTRRVIAFCIDMVLIGFLVVGLSLASLIAGFVTFGLAWLGLAFVAPVAAIAYYALTLGSSRRATVGMQMTDIVLTPTRDTPLDGWMAVAHAALFWVTIWISWPISLAIALFTPRRQMVHDMLLGSLMVRRSPMARHWAELRSGSGDYAPSPRG